MSIKEVLGLGFDAVKNSYTMMFDKFIEKFNDREMRLSGLRDEDNLSDVAKCLFCYDMLMQLNELGEQEDTPETREMLQKIKEAKLKDNIYEAEALKAYEDTVRNDFSFSEKFSLEDISEGVFAAIYPRYRDAVRKSEKLNKSTINVFEEHRKSLINAKTDRNSKEYEDIIKAVEWVNKTGTFFEKGKLLTGDQRYAAKLLVIKNSINKYLEHKAKHGVNKNIGDKLAVVEKLNKEVSEKLEELKPQVRRFKINGKKVNLKNLPFTIEQEKAVALGVNPEGANQIPPAWSKDDSLSNDCMKRIISKAIEKKYSSSYIRKLENMRNNVFGKKSEAFTKTVNELANGKGNVEFDLDAIDHQALDEMIKANEKKVAKAEQRKSEQEPSVIKNPDEEKKLEADAISVKSI